MDEQERVKCDTCHRLFKTKRILLQHQRRNNCTRTGKRECNQCGGYFTLTALSRHKKTTCPMRDQREEQMEARIEEKMQEKMESLRAELKTELAAELAAEEQTVAPGIIFEDTREIRTRRVKVPTLAQARALFARQGTMTIEDPGLQNEVTDAALEEVVNKGEEMPTMKMTQSQKVANTSKMLLATSGALLTSATEVTPILPACEKGESAYVLHMAPTKGQLTVEKERTDECASRLFGVSRMALEEFINRKRKEGLGEQMKVLSETYKNRQEDVMKKSRNKLPLLLLSPESLVPVRVGEEGEKMQFMMCVMDDPNVTSQDMEFLGETGGETEGKTGGKKGGKTTADLGLFSESSESECEDEDEDEESKRWRENWRQSCRRAKYSGPLSANERRKNVW
jgi:hypothetical protein